MEIKFLDNFARKKTDFALISKSRLTEIENLINDRPKKVLGYKAPNEVWSEYIKKVKLKVKRASENNW